MPLFVNPTSKTATLALGRFANGSATVVPYTAQRCPLGSHVAVRCSVLRAAQWVRIGVLRQLTAKEPKLPEDAILDLDAVEAAGMEAQGQRRRQLTR